MQFTNQTRQQDLGLWAEQIATIAEQENAPNGAARIQQALKQWQADRFVLAIVGKAKRGKSTLINALLARDDDIVAPIDKLPASSTVSRFGWSEREQAKVFFREGGTLPIPYSQIREYVTEELNPANQKHVELVEIFGPFVGLDRDLALIDTPGAGSLHEHHDALLHAFIPQADAVIFLVTARMPIDAEESDLLAKLKAADVSKVFFAINRVDETAEQDLKDAIAHNSRLLADIGISVGKMYPISAKQARQGAIEASGLPELSEDLGRFLAAHRGRVMRNRLVSRVRQAVNPLLQKLQVQIEASQWNDERRNAELGRLNSRCAEIEERRVFAERKFSVTWKKALAHFETGVNISRGDVIRAVESAVAGAPLHQLGSFVKRLPTLVAQTVEAKLLPWAQEFEQTAQTACEQLQVDFPALSLKPGAGIHVTSRSDHRYLAVSAGGVTLAASGAGLAAAGSAAAASLAAATTTVVAPSALTGVATGLASWLGSSAWGIPAGIAHLATPLTVGTATLPAVVTAPLWVALSGPVGWTLAGVGAIAIPVSWRISRIKQKEQLQTQCVEQVNRLFEEFSSTRIPAIRSLADNIVEEFRIGLDEEVQEIRTAISESTRNRADQALMQQRQSKLAELRGLVDQGENLRL
jgi:GTPase SAR1 family protein